MKQIKVDSSTKIELVSYEYEKALLGCNRIWPVGPALVSLSLPALGIIWLKGFLRTRKRSG